MGSLAFLVALSLATAPPTPVVVDGQPLPASALATIANRAYVELRAVGQAMNASVAFDAKVKRATLTTEFRQAVLTIGSTRAVVNGEPRAIDAAPQLVNGRVMVPLRALAKALGATVRYDQESHAVLVSTAALNGPGPLPPGATGAHPPSANTLEGTVTDVQAGTVPPAVAVDVDQLSYTITVPEGTAIQFRDTRGGTTGSGTLAQVRPGDTLIATLDVGGHLISIADIFTGYGGKIASIAGQSMVLTNGRVVTADGTKTTVELDGRTVAFPDLRAGDLVTVRADPRTGKVRDVVALTPGGLATTATATPAPSSSSGATVGGISIAGVTDDASHAFRAGQTLHVAMDGTPGGAATFDLSNIVVGNRMEETRPGHYQGSYAVQVGTNLVDAPIVVHLTKSGVTAQAEAPDPLAIITSPPTVQDAKPDPASQVNNPRPNIYATFASFGDRGMDAQTLKLVVNGKDVSGQATKTAAFISYLPTADLSGTVTVEMSGTDTAGNPLYFKWSFTVVR